MFETSTAAAAASALLATLLLLPACRTTRPVLEPDRPVPLVRLVERGFAIDRSFIHGLDGRCLSVWGYLDVANLDGGRFTNERKRRLVTPPHFDLKARPFDPPGFGVRVKIVGEDPAFRPLVERLTGLAAKAEDDEHRVVVQGRLHSFEAVGNLWSATGFELTVSRPGSIVILSPAEDHPKVHPVSGTGCLGLFQ